MRLYHLIFLIPFLLPVKTTSQVNFVFDQQEAENLSTSLPALSGCELADVINQLAYLYVRRNPEYSDSLLNMAFELSREFNCMEAEAIASYTKGILEYVRGNYTAAYEKLFYTLDYCQENQDTALVIDTYYHLASLSYFSRTDVQQGITYMKKALELAIVSFDSLRIAQAYAAMGYVSFHAGDGKRGKEMFERYFRYSVRLHVSRMEKALMLASYGDCFELLGDIRTAIDIYLKALSIFDPKSIEERALLSQCSAYLGERYLIIGKPDSALYYFHDGMDLARKYSHAFGSMINAVELAEYYYDSSSFSLCKSYCDSILFFGKRIEVSGSFFGNRNQDYLLGASMEIFVPMTPGYKKYVARTAMYKALRTLQDMYEKRGSIDQAYKVIKATISLQDSIIRYEQKKELMEVLSRNETEQKEKKILILSKENEIQEMKIRQNNMLLFMLLILIIFIVLIALILTRQNKLKSDHQSSILKQRLFRSQMNPHFIFNAMGNIQSSIINEEPDKAIKYLSRFSKLMRNILDASLKEKVLLSEEIETSENYLQLQKIRFYAKFDYSIEVDENIDPELVSIPPMLIQPFIENAIEHGINHKNLRGNITIRIKRVNDMIVFEIKDDGVGRQRAKQILYKRDKEHRSYATALTQDRIEDINKKLKKKIRFHIFDLKDDTGKALGTKVVFEIPCKLE